MRRGEFCSCSNGHIGIRLVIASTVLMLWLGMRTAYAGALVELPNVSEHAYPQRLLGYLARPDSSGPFPAVVVLHGCKGFSPAYAAIADDLKSIGYVALTIDSLGRRDSTGECDRFFIGQEIDAYAALAYLAQLPFVDPSRVAVLGFSMGGRSALFTVQRGDVETRFTRKFRAAIAYYPSCRGFSAIMYAPTLILIGNADDWTPAEACREMVARPHNDGSRVDLYVYPGAYHGFNFREAQPGFRVLGHWIEYDPAAAADAWEKVRAFLAENLAKQAGAHDVRR